MLKLLRVLTGAPGILTERDRQRMLENGRQRRLLAGKEDTEAQPDFIPVVKLFTPDANCVWLLTDLDFENPDIAWGLCDLGMGWPELAHVRISEIGSIRGPGGQPVKRDPHFRSDVPISNYAEDARARGRIVA